jgi:hypothetical protein
VSKTIDSKAKEAIERGREELQNPDMAKFDKAMKALLKTGTNREEAVKTKRKDD